MTMPTRFITTPAPRRLGRAGLGLAALVAALALPLNGCHVLDVSTPDIVPVDNLNNAAALPTVRAGAIGDFGIAYDGSGAQGSSGTTEGLVQLGGMLGDELINTETFPDRVQTDARQSDPNSATLGNVFANLSRARASAEAAVVKFRTLSDTTTNGGLSEMLSLAGLTYLLYAENYCNGVPIDQLQPDGTIKYGVQLTTSQMLDTAQNRFTQAAGAATALPTGTTKTNMVALANVGLARTLVDKGNFAGADAAASAANVPTTFNYLMQHDLNSFRQQNGVFNALRNFKRYGVPDSSEGGVGFNWRGLVGGAVTPDARNPVFRAPGTNFGFDKKTPQYDQLRYVDQKASTTVSTGAEARLINAEAALQRGDTVSFMANLNGLRAGPPGYYLAGSAANPTLANPIAPMTPLTTPTSPAASVNLLFAERARWLWLTGHRLSDMRRLIRQYGRGVNTVFPNGAYFKNNLIYGTDVNLPVPITEQNNPNFVLCIDRNP